MDTPETETKPKRKKRGTSPTMRSLGFLRRAGYTADPVEKFIPRAGRFGVRRDFCGFADVLAFRPETLGVLAIQCCTGSTFAAHREKIVTNPYAVLWLKARNQIRLDGWVKRGPAGKQKRWECRQEYFDLESMAPEAVANSARLQEWEVEQSQLRGGPRRARLAAFRAEEAA